MDQQSRYIARPDGVKADLLTLAPTTERKSSLACDPPRDRMDGGAIGCHVA
jgi:hypothetical protein